MAISRLLTALFALGLTHWCEALAAPGVKSQLAERATPSSSYWYQNIAKQGVAPFAPSGYQVYRNVMDFGAKGLLLYDFTYSLSS